MKMVVKRIKILLVLMSSLVITACASVDTIKIPTEVPEIHPGLLAGYLKPEVPPNSLKLVPPPPADGSAALAFDEEVSKKALALQNTSRWELATKDADLMFPVMTRSSLINEFDMAVISFQGIK